MDDRWSKAVNYGPILLTLCLIVWTVAVSPYSKYGDNWAIYPAAAVLPLAIGWHLYLAFAAKFRFGIVAYGLIHVAALTVIWLYCLMKISKDAL